MGPGLAFVINLTIGAVTPPAGTILHTVCSILGVSVEDFTKELWPVLIALVAVLALVTHVPPLILRLPNFPMGT